MFLQIGLHESQRDVTRVIWLKDYRQPILSNENIQEYRFWDHFKSFTCRSNNRNPLERYGSELAMKMKNEYRSTTYLLVQTTKMMLSIFIKNQKQFSRLFQ